MSSPGLRAFFYLAGALGTVTTWGRTVLDGSFALLQTLLDGGRDTLLPGTHSPVRLVFTGIPPLDYLFRTLVIFFWEALDGSHPVTTTVGIYFAVQLVPIILAVYLDGLRSGNGASALRPSLWFLVFGAAAIGCSGAVWGLLYVGSSPTLASVPSVIALQRSSMFASHRAAAVLLPAILIGYVGPLVVMGLPSPTLVSADFQQWAIVAWNTFPLAVLGLVRAGEAMWNVFQPPKYKSMDVTEPKHAPLQLWVVRRLGLAGILAGFAGHAGVGTVSLSAWLFPALFKTDALAASLTPRALISLAPLTTRPVETLGEGIHGFMVWDQIVGFSIVLGVFLSQLRHAQQFSTRFPRPATWLGTVLSAALGVLVVGPGATVLAASWIRDEILFDETVEHNPPSGTAGNGKKHIARR